MKDYKFKINDKVLYVDKRGRSHYGTIQTLITRGLKKYYDVDVVGLKKWKRMEESRLHNPSCVIEIQDKPKKDNEYLRLMFKQECEFLYNMMKENLYWEKNIIGAHLREVNSYFEQMD